MWHSHIVWQSGAVGTPDRRHGLMHLPPVVLPPPQPMTSVLYITGSFILYAQLDSHPDMLMLYSLLRMC